MPSCGVRLFVCLSVRMSVTFVYSVETSKHILKLFYHPVDPPFRFSIPSLTATFRRGLPNWGKSRDFRPIFGFGIDDFWTVECRQQFNGGIYM